MLGFGRSGGVFEALEKAPSSYESLNRLGYRGSKRRRHKMLGFWRSGAVQKL